jgi:hypothetical protein
MHHPHLWLWVAAPAGVLVALIASCGSSASSQFPGGGDGGANGGDGSSNHGDGRINLGSGGTSGLGGGDSGPACTGLQCQSQKDNCSGKGKPPTTVTGVVYDPAGALPLYDVYVYIPNSKPDPIDPGNPACTQCEAYASGGPIIGTLTNAMGEFTLAQGTGDQYGVPSGTNIPLVIQTGKWRKQITVPSVTACGSTAIPNPTTPADKLRLPANSSEGDMPLIAFTSGCDPAECFLRDIGIADSEFVAPTTPPPAAWPTVTPGTGHVHFFTANDNTTGGAASSVTGGNTVADTYAWWQSSANLLQYDIVFNACECTPTARGATAYPAMDAYLNGGGRLFTTHYYYNWFAPSPPASADLYSVAEWDPTMSGSSGAPEADSIDQTFPKGVAFADWLQDNAITTTLGSITLVDTRDNLTGINPAGCEATMTCLSTQWIYDTADMHPRYISWNTPVGATATKQCGRAVFSDVHLSGTSNNATFPTECATADPGGTHATNEKALEFLFFDLSSCVQNDNQPPTMPPPPPPPPK